MVPTDNVPSRTRTKENTMSNQFGKTITVDVSAVYDEKTLQAFAKKAGITLQAARSLAHNVLYRKEYTKLRNQLPEVKAKRKAENARRRLLAKQLNAMAR
jgi:hypothetical protein